MMIGARGITWKRVMASVLMRKYRSAYLMGGFGSVTTKGLPACGNSEESGRARMASKSR